MKLLFDVPTGFGTRGRRRAVTAPLHWLAARATSAARTLPGFMIIGAMKAGTTSLASYLFRHPAVGAPRRKEIHYFDSPAFARGDRWYRAHFPLYRPDMISGEASPYYLAHPHCPRRIHELVPAVKLIVMLRNPIDRALSHYHHQIRHDREPLTFSDALKAESERLDGEYRRMLEDESFYSERYWAYSYLTRGRYAEQLDRWLELFPREQILIIQSEAFFQEPRRWHLATLAFLGLEPAELADYPKQNTGRYDDMDPKLRHELQQYFRPENARLEALLAQSFSWD